MATFLRAVLAAGLIGAAVGPAAAGEPFRDRKADHHDRADRDRRVDRDRREDRDRWADRDVRVPRDRRDTDVWRRHVVENGGPAVVHDGANVTANAAVSVAGAAAGESRSVVAPPGHGRLFALCVEVDHKKIDHHQKDEDAKEAIRMAAVLKEKGRGVYSRVETRVLVGRAANRAGILGGLHWLKEQMRPADVGVVFISSHGGFDGMGFFGVQPAGFKEKDQKHTAVWGQEIRESLARTAGRLVFWLETCNSAVFLRTPVKVTPVDNALVICSASDKESSGAAMGYALIDGLSGAAAGPGGVVTAGGLKDYAMRRVVRDTKGTQHAVAALPPQRAEAFARIPLTRK